MDSRDQHPIEHGFRMRGAGMSRLDVFSDVVFAFALVLLAVSLTVPKSFQAVHESALALVILAICFAMIVGGWISHYTFFRRYGLHDRFTLVLNTCLLFLILFCVYPLKFLYSTIIGYLFRNDFSAKFAATVQVMGILALYAVGFAMVFVLVAALYWNAWRLRDSLALNGVERLLTVSSIVDALGLSAIGLMACLASLILPSAWTIYSTLLYFLIVPWKALNAFYFGRKARTLRKLVAAPTL